MKPIIRVSRGVKIPHGLVGRKWSLSGDGGCETCILPKKKLKMKLGYDNNKIQDNIV